MHLTPHLRAKACAAALALCAFTFATAANAQSTAAQPANGSDLAGTPTRFSVVAPKTLPLTLGAELTPTPTPTPEPSVQNPGQMADRIKSYDRNAPRRENLTGIKIVKHVNGLFGGFEQSAGFGFGVELTTADSIPGIELRARALTSTKFYRKGEVGFYVPKVVNDSNHIEVYYTYLRRTKDHFFGIGPRTTDAFATNFDMEQRSVTGNYSSDFGKRIQAGFFGRYANTATYRGANEDEPPVDVIFTGNPATNEPLRFAPGLRRTIGIYSFGPYVEANLRNDEKGLTRGGYFYGKYSANTSTGSRNSDYGWSELELDGRAYLPLGSDKTSLALRAYTDLKNPYGTDNLIPFYEQAFLGGRSFVRGFDNFRFRANSLLLFSTELRQTVFKQKDTRGVDLVAFGDGGQVWGDNRPNLPAAFRGNDDFKSANWRFGVGGGVQYRYNKDFAVRIDFAHTNEANKIYFSVGRGF